MGVAKQDKQLDKAESAELGELQSVIGVFASIGVVYIQEEVCRYNLR